jgi:hypothetical protein
MTTITETRRDALGPAGGYACVNLLPPEHAQRKRAQRTTRLSVIGLAAWLAVLGGVHYYKTGEVESARLDRDVAQAEVDALEIRLAELEPYRQLAEALESRNTLLAYAMEEEVSWAQVLNDVSLTFPADSSLLTLTVTSEQPEIAEGDVDRGPSIAAVGWTGYTTKRYAPGVETTLVDFSEVSNFFDTFLASADKGDIDGTEVTNFNGSVQLSDEAYTHRYEDGLPPEVDQ